MLVAVVVFAGLVVVRSPLRDAQPGSALAFGQKLAVSISSLAAQRRDGHQSLARIRLLLDERRQISIAIVIRAHGVIRGSRPIAEALLEGVRHGVWMQALGGEQPLPDNRF